MTDGGSPAVRRFLWPYGFLLVFVLVVRVLPAITRPAGAEDNCERVSHSDLAAMERCAAIHPEDAELLIDLGDWYRQAGDRSRAHSLYSEALKIDPADGEVRRRMDALR
jgi:cytochrome c-type biogenesis protein CcmH/NrfG